MPSFKTHSIHGELLFKDINKEINLNIEDFKSFCMGPDILILSDYNTFIIEHISRVRYYYNNLLRLIKDNKLQDNSEVISFLYGHLDHLVLDSIIHPLIYYMTDNKGVFEHTLAEHQIDNYIIDKYNINNNKYYKKTNIKDPNLKTTLDILYKDVFGTRNESIKYNMGLKYMTYYDNHVRHYKLLNKTGIAYKDDYTNIMDYLNLNHDTWYNPETKEKYNSSFEDLWKKSIEVFLTTIDEVNRYLYKDGVLNCKIINENTSYDTGLPCEMGQQKLYVKKYTK